VTQTPPQDTDVAARPRPARRAPSDLPFRFATAELAEALASRRGEPDWLRAERLDAAQAFDALPIEANHLYTPYIDLRPAQLDAVEPYILDGPAGLGADLEPIRSASGLPDGVHVETMSEWLARDPAGARAALDRGGAEPAGLPAEDRLAHLARGFWSHGRHVEIAAGLKVDRPIALRWPEPDPGRALVTRTIVSLGPGASASIVEELVPAGEVGRDAGAPEGVPQGFFHGTTEVVLGEGAALAVASIQELSERAVVFQHRHARVGEAATLHWALAQLGSRLVRSRVDNRLEGDRSSVEQVEIVFGGDEQLL
jgi:Fe-S cluster assembly scaffold protein SufB